MMTGTVRKLGPFQYVVAPTKPKKVIEKIEPAVDRGYNTARKHAHKMLNEQGASEATITIRKVK